MHIPDKQEDFDGYQNIERWVGFFVGIVFIACTLFFDPPEGMSLTAWKCLGMGSLMAAWWATEAIPIPVTSLLPIVLIPLLGLGNITNATSPYANPTIYLFLGGFLIGLGMEKWNLHRRVALNIINIVGYRGRYQIAGFMAATAFISMWVSNTATAIMMLPIGLSVINLVVKGDNPTPDQKRFSTALLLAIAYGASLGGIATLIGTPPNALLKAYLEEHYKIHIGFGQWMILGVPTALVMLTATWYWLCRKRFNLNAGDAEIVIRGELSKLGKWSKGEKYIGVVFLCAAGAWVFQPLISTVFPLINDTIIAMIAGVMLFIIPIDRKKRIFLMDWETGRKLPWGTLILFGGGLSLAGVVTTSGLADWVAMSLGRLDGLSVITMLLVISAVIIFLTELTSNTATAAAFLPLLGALAVTQGVPPQLFTIPAAIAASCAFMMPVATPPNAIVFGSGKIAIMDMIKAGLFLNIIGIFVVAAMSYIFMGLF